MIPFYYKIKTKSTISNELLAFSKTSNDWFESNGFSVLIVPKEIIFKDSILKDIVIQFNANPTILRMPAKSMYDWHTDGKRSAAINILLDGFDSFTFFGKKFNPQISSVTELVYSPDEMFLINTSLPHGVYTRNNTRTVFSLGFTDSNSFYSVLKYVSAI